MKLYSVVYIARRIVGDDTEIRVNPVLLTSATEESALQEAQQSAPIVFPSSEGWIDQALVWVEIEQGMPFDDGRRLVWEIREPQSENGQGEEHGTDRPEAQAD